MGLDMYLYALKKVDENDDIEKIDHAFTYYDYIDYKKVTKNDFDKVNPEDYWLYTNEFWEDLDFDIVDKYKDYPSNEDWSLCSELIYWGKANAINKFFIENSIDYNKDLPREDYNSRYLEISPKTLIELRDRCQAILDSVSSGNGVAQAVITFENGPSKPIIDEKNTIKDYSLAKELLPTQDGFWFGSINYDEYYLNKLEYTIEELNSIFSYNDWEDYHYYYYPSW